MQILALLAGAVLWQAPAAAQDEREAPARRAPAPQVVSPEVTADRSVLFRIRAPQAQAVRLNAGDIPGTGEGAALAKSAEGVWELRLDSVPPGAYRYRFDIDGVPVVDPRNPATSESNAHTWSLVHVPGAAFMDTQDVPHGAVAEIAYHSKSLGRLRRLHVYTPPGYEAGSDRYPVFYLLHGAFDCDDSWSTVGRAGHILDNLLAAGKAKPMVVVMPAGHTGPFRFGRRNPSVPRGAVDEFTQDFLGDIMPLVESRYRVLGERRHRAIAGLSMGGNQTLNIAVPNLEKFGAIGVFSSGVFGGRGRGDNNAAAEPSWEERHKEALDNAELKKGLDLVWFATGTDDFLIETSRSSVALLRHHGFDVVFKETAGGHTWTNWREYLAEFAALLFRERSEQATPGA